MSVSCFGRHAVQYACGTCYSVKLSRVPLTYCRKKNLHVSTAIQHQQQGEEKLKIKPEPPLNPKSDWIGPPDPKSNIRPYKFYIPENETRWQKEFRLRREDNRIWNHEFWIQHNEAFYKQKEEFVKKKLIQKGLSDDDRTTLTPEEMSEFYKKFLDDKFISHMQYNKDWYKRNISLLWPAMKVSVERFWSRKFNSS